VPKAQKTLTDEVLPWGLALGARRSLFELPEGLLLMVEDLLEGVGHVIAEFGSLRGQ